jgi:ankyrin repeat protein
MRASEKGSANIVQVLMENQADVNVKDVYGATALIRATEQGHINIIRLLLKSADVNIQDEDGVSALMAAAAKGHEHIVALLLEKGANPQLKNSDGKTARQLAEAKHFDAITTLFDKANIPK